MLRRWLVLLVVVAALLAVAGGLAGFIIPGGERILPAGAGSVRVVVRPSETAGEIGQSLHNAGLIPSAGAFQALAELTGAGDRLQAGEYEFRRGTPMPEILAAIRDGRTAVRTVTIPEGLRTEEITDLLAKGGIVTKDAFLAALFRAAPTQPVFADRPKGVGWEGYLFPDTYRFPRDTSADQVFSMMLDDFAQRVTPAVVAGFHAEGLSVYQGLTLASIVEREARAASERPIIASVFLNRLRLGMPLQADPTVQYAVGLDPANVARFGYWKQDLSAADLQIASPYNTYQHTGLPPGPICNPGVASIEAVAFPAKTDYLYFVAKGDGTHAFARTLAEQEANVAKYRH